MSLAVITGASSGLGREYALAVARLCPDIDEILVIARRRERLEALSDQISGKTVHVLALDLTADGAMDDLRSFLAGRAADIRLLVNNAGFGVLGWFKDGDWRRQAGMCELNCAALTAVTHTCLPFMKAGSAIVNVSSIASFVPTPRMAVYSSTKAFVLSFSKALRCELKSEGINVCAVCPAPMTTEFLPVAGIESGNSPTFDRLPRVKPEGIAEGSIKAARKGRVVYTGGALYKLYRVLGKLLPHNWLMKFTTC